MSSATAAAEPSEPGVTAAAETTGLVKSYGDGDATVRAVDGIDLRIERGSFVAVMGPSGSGKSTLLHCIAGLDRPTSGQVRIGGTDLAELKDEALTRLRRDRVGFVFQAFNLIPTLTARENVLLPLTLGRRDADPALVRDRHGGPGACRPARAPVRGAVRGQQQRVAVARALVTRPEIVFGDEPTGNLDRAGGAELLKLLRRSIDGLGQTIVMVTHDPAAVATADHILLLADGRVVDTLAAPTVERVLTRIRELEG